MTPEIEKRIKAVKAGRVPAGYKKTKVGIVPKEWDERILSDISIHVTEKNRNNDFQTTFTNSATKGVIKQTEYFDKQISNKDNTDGYYVVRKFDYIYNPRISESAPCGPINQSHFDETGIVSPLYTVFRLHKDLKENHYIEAYLKSHFWHRYMCGVANYGARHDRMNITNEDLFNLPIPFPPFEEQKKIAEILSAQDKIIELKENLIAEKQRQKKYLTQTLLDEKIKRTPFKINNVVIDKGKWECTTIGAIAHISTGNKDTQNKKDNGVYPFYVRSPNPERINTYSYDGEAILTAGDGVGVGKVIHYVTGKFDFHQRVYKISDFCSNVMGKYVFYFFSEFFYNRVIRMSAKNSVDSVRYNMIADMPIALPTLPEQQAIAAVLSSADEEISLLQHDLEQEKLKKKSLMQLLLTGLVRVK